MNTKDRCRFPASALAVAFLLNSLLPAQAAPAAPIGGFNRAYTFTTIDVPDAAATSPEGINDCGQVVGWFLTVDNTVFHGDLRIHGFLYDHGEFTFIQVPDALDTAPFGINDHGEIVGSYVNHGQRGFLFDSKKDKGENAAFSFIVVPFPTGVGLTRPNGINNYGRIVGEYLDNFSTGNQQHGFLDDEGVFTSIDVPGAIAAAAYGINDQGQIVGFYATDGNGRGNHGFVLNGGVFTTIDVPFAGGFNTGAVGINNRGEIVGIYTDSSGRAIHGFVCTDGVFTSIDAPGARNTTPLGINDRGQIVGRYYGGDAGEGHGFVATPK